VGDYQAPLFLAWQLTNRCQAKCLTCCEESGPDKGWKDELTKDEALSFSRDVVKAGIPYAAFGGGEPLGVPFCWDIFDILVAGGTELKLETNGLYIDNAAADKLKEYDTNCIQISIDGATKATHERVRPLGDFNGVMACMERLVERDLRPEWVFVPNKLNIHEIVDAFDTAAKIGCRTFVTGPMMRLGRAAQAYDSLGLSPEEWQAAAAKLEERQAKHPQIKLSIYPWDILTEMKTRLDSPQAMVLVVPNGKAKLLNALPFAPADVRTDSIAEAWAKYQDAWVSDEVRDFIETAQTQKELLLHANETWPMGTWTQKKAAAQSSK
jgi:MoaA/NifB/PqqE/SkfB family radical SAM enzyme